MPKLSTKDVQIQANRLRVDSDALIVLVIGVNDVSFSVDPSVSPRDAGETVENVIGGLVQQLTEARKRGKH